MLSNLSLNLKVNKGYSVNFRLAPINIPAKRASGDAPFGQNETTLSISATALKLFEDRQKQAEAEREKNQKAMDAKKEKIDGLNKLKETKRAAIAQRIGEIKERLKELVKRMEKVFWFGDKKAAALIAKEAAALAKEVKALVRQAAMLGKQGGAVSPDDAIVIPNLNDSGTENDSPENIEGDEKIAEQEADPEAEVAAAEAEQAARDAQQSSAEENEGRVEEEKDKERVQMNEIKDAVKEALDKASNIALKADVNITDDGPISEHDKMIIKTYLRYIIFMAKAVLKSKPILGSDKPEAHSVDGMAEKEIEKADKDIEEAIREIDEL